MLDYTINDNALKKALSRIDTDLLSAKDYDKGDHVHRLFQYPARMVPETQEVILKEIVKFLPKDAYVLDPFMGSATSLVTTMNFGLNIHGQDINPLAILLSKVKTGPFLYSKFRKEFIAICNSYDSDESETIDVQFNGLDKWFRTEVQISLSKLRRAILNISSINSRRFFWVVLAETIRLTSNDRTSTYKLHARPLEVIENRVPDVLREFKLIANRNLEDLNFFREKLLKKSLLRGNTYLKNVKIKYGDSSKSLPYTKKFSLLVTSPPYGDNHTTVTYGQHSYLPLQWIKLSDIDPKVNNTCLITTSEIDKRSLGGRKLKLKTGEIKKLYALSGHFKKYYEGLNDDDRKKNIKVLDFVYDLNKTIDKVIDVLDSNAYLVWTIGNRYVNGEEIKNDQILKEILESKGLKIIVDFERDILNKRMPNRNRQSKTMSKEKILIFRKTF